MKSKVKFSMPTLKSEVRRMEESLLLRDQDVDQWLKSTKMIRSFVRLPGDASTRKYFRILTHSQKTFILMKMDPFEEKENAFLNVRRHLDSVGVNVPSVLDVQPEKGLMLLEDLGDVTLLKRLQTVSSPDVERGFYERVIDGLIQLQICGSHPKSHSSSLEAFKLRFDVEKLMWEVKFTIENFYQTYLKRVLRSEDLSKLEGRFLEICTLLAAEPLVFVHRDFHSRNVMLTSSEGEDRWVMIDFQDARMGPPQYDLASLLRDSYYQLSEDQIERLLEYYMTRYEALSKVRIDRHRFRMVLDLMTVQRNFKAIGSFASFMNRRGDPSYLKYIGNTFENIRKILLRYPKFSDLREILFEYYYF